MIQFLLGLLIGGVLATLLSIELLAKIKGIEAKIELLIAHVISKKSQEDKS